MPTIDIGKVEQIVSAIIGAAPAIEQGVMSAAPYVQAIVSLIEHGGAPSNDDWAALKARLDAGTAALQAAANAPDPSA